MAEGLVLEWTTEEGVQLKLTAGTDRIEEVTPGAELVITALRTNAENSKEV